MASATLIRSASNKQAPDEQNPLLTGEFSSRYDGEQWLAYQPWSSNPFQDLPVYENIWRIRKLLISSVQDPYSLEQFRAPRLNTSLVRPLLTKFLEQQDVSMVFCLLVNRAQFLKDQSYQAHAHSVNTSRAKLCELLAVRLLRQYDDNSHGLQGLLLLSTIVIAGFHPFQNAPEGIFTDESRARPPQNKEEACKGQITALEVAILSESKLFLSSPACRRVIDAIYCGRIVYTPTSFIDLLADHYKRRPISIYNPRKAPVLNQYRLAVPKIRNFIEVFHFVVLLALYILVMTGSNSASHFSRIEIIFCTYVFGWILDQMASILAHGWTVYSQNLWSYLDISFCLIYIVYFALRIHSIFTKSDTSEQLATDILAMASPFLIPRLGFNIFSENLVFVALREMMARFMLLVLLATWTFTGFLLAMLWLGEGSVGPETIGKWMIWVWFGLDGTGIEESIRFHKVLGPVLMISFAILGNTLFLTIVVSTLGNAFNKISHDSTAEVEFRRAVLTFEAVKSDAIFAFSPPFNILALIIMIPLKILLSPRWFHKVHTVAVRTINAPLLFLISVYDRLTLWPTEREDNACLKLVKRLYHGDFAQFHFHSDIQDVFKSPPPKIERRVQSLQSVRRKSMNGESVRDRDTHHDGERYTGQSSEGGSPKKFHSTVEGDIEERLKRIEFLVGRICESMNAEEDENE